MITTCDPSHSYTRSTVLIGVTVPALHITHHNKRIDLFSELYILEFGLSWIGVGFEPVEELSVVARTRVHVLRCVNVRVH